MLQNAVSWQWQRLKQGDEYINCGDWVESCAAVAEREDGGFEIITWTDSGRKPLALLAQAQAA
jgi:hypothetical protein